MFLISRLPHFLTETFPRRKYQISKKVALSYQGLRQGFPAAPNSIPAFAVGRHARLLTQNRELWHAKEWDQMSSVFKDLSIEANIKIATVSLKHEHV